MRTFRGEAPTDVRASPKSRRCISLLLLLAMLAGSTGGSPLAAAARGQVQLRSENSQSVLFIENVGQFHPAGEAGGTPAPRFLLHGSQYAIWLAEDGLWLALSAAGADTGPRAEGAPNRGTTVNLHLTFPGSNPHPRLEPFNRSETHVSYFLGSDPARWRPDVPVWRGVRYHSLFQDMDLLVTADGLRLVVRNTADPEALNEVRLRIEGAENVAVLDSQLRLDTAVGELALPLLQVVDEEGKPHPQAVFHSWEARAAGAISPSGETAGLRVFDLLAPFAPPGTARALAVPAVSAQPNPDAGDLLYSTYLGGSTGYWGGGDDVHDVAVDATGTVYVTGYTQSSNFPTTSGAFSTTLASNSEDAFVAKLNASGSALLYATFLGGTWEDRGYGIAVDGQGNAYVTGMTRSPNWSPTSGGFPVTPGAFDEDYSNGSEGFVTKLNPNGTALLYSSYLGSYTGDDNGWDIAVDVAGNAYVAGDTYGGYPFEQYPGWDHTTGYTLVGFAVKVNPSGSALVFSTYLGGGYSDSARGIAVDASGGVYVVGRAGSADFPTTTTIGGNALGSTDAFVVRLNPDGVTPVYSARFGGSGYDAGGGVAVDASGAAYVTGYTLSTNLPVTPGCFDPTPNGSADIFVAKITGTVLSYCTYFGGSGWEMDPLIGLNADNEAVVAGITFSPDLLVSPDAFDTTHGGGTCGAPPDTSPCADVFLLRLNIVGSAGEYATFLGGTGSDWLYGLAVDASSRAYLAGMTQSADFPVSPGAFDSTLGGTQDGFVAKIEPVGEPLGPTRTPTPTPTRSPTPTATATLTVTPTPTATPPLPDLVADELEVTQAVQDLNNSVRLVANKRTFVRFHAHSTLGQYSTYAQVRLERNGDTQTLTSESRTVRETPDRSVYEHSFLFELPDGYKEGTVKIQAEVNPDTAWRMRSPQEARYDNNGAEASLTFEDVPPLNVVIYRVSYEVGGSTYTAPLEHAMMLEDWLRYGYPVSSVRTWLRTFSYGSGLPDCMDINSILSRKRLWDKLTAWSVPADTRYYGMVDDGGGFMRGCAPAVKALVASGPTGGPHASFAAWDTDGCYGDWYGAHELGHAYGRGHANFCGAAGGPVYPYPNGSISPGAAGRTALYGLNGGTLDVYPPSWKDLMTYCDFEWMSDFTYEGLMTSLQVAMQSAAAADASALVDRLLAVGTINLDTNSVDLQPLIIVPDAPDIEPRQPGPFAIVLRGPGGELARHAFTPTEVAWGRPAPGATWDSPRLLAFQELLPYVAGTTRVDVEGPNGVTLLTVNAGAAAPAVSVTQPAAGQTLSSETVTVAWTAQDVDGDPLSFDLQYSPDDGATWELVAQAVKGSSVQLETANLVRSNGTTGRVRVWASDGIHSAYADSAALTVPNHPPTAEILPPTEVISTTGGIVIAAGQTLTLGGNAYDVDLGTLPAQQVAWSSNVQGPLGEGSTISTASLQLGTHVITVRADDGAGGVAADSITVTVVSDPLQLPQPPDGLRISPKQVLLEPAASLNTQTVGVENRNPSRYIRWSATVGVPWLSLSHSSGVTPADIIVSYNGRHLPLGTHTGTVTFQSADVPEQTVAVIVQLSVSSHPVYLPVILRRFNPVTAPTPTGTATATSLPTSSRTLPATRTITATPTQTATSTPTRTATRTAVASATPTVTRTATASPTPTCTWRDDYGSATLNSVWHWVREDSSHWSLSARPGYLRITTQSGDLWQGNNNNHNMLLQPAPLGDWQISTRVEINPSQDYQQAVLLAYQDDDNYLRADRLFNQPLGGNMVEFIYERNGQVQSHTFANNLTSICLRIVKTGTEYAAHYSPDGVAWTEIGRYSNVALTNPGVGISAWGSLTGAPPAAEIPADFDWFCIEAALPAPSATASATPTATRTVSSTPELGWQTILSDGFEGSYPGPWQRLGEPTWGRTRCRAFAGQYSLWPAADGAGAAEPCSGNYPDNLSAILTYGPFDLRGATAAQVSFQYWQRTQREHDFFLWLASVDGESYYGWQSSGESEGWLQTTFDLSNVEPLGDLRGQPQVWIAFAVQSDASVNDAGVFLDDVLLRRKTGGALAPPVWLSAPIPGLDVQRTRLWLQ